LFTSSIFFNSLFVSNWQRSFITVTVSLLVYVEVYFYAKAAYFELNLGWVYCHDFPSAFSLRDGPHSLLPRNSFLVNKQQIVYCHESLASLSFLGNCLRFVFCYDMLRHLSLRFISVCLLPRNFFKFIFFIF
jgi:hypothetical protein